MKRASAPTFLNGYTLLLVTLAVYLPLFWQLPLIRSESMYALIPKEMLASGSWLTPSLNGVPYLDKPHLIYWLNLIAYKILGQADWVARIPTIIISVCEVWLTYLIGRRLLDRTAAWLGAFVLASSVGFCALHLQILIDHLITLCLLVSLYSFLRWQEQPGFRWGAVFHLSLVAGFLSKGFIGLVFPVLILLIFTWPFRQTRIFSLFLSSKGLALIVLLIAPWVVGVEQANPGFLKFQIINEQVMRFLGQRQPPDINSFSLPGFWLFLGIWLMPWTFLLPEGCWRLWRESCGGGSADPRSRLLLIWPAVILVFYTLSSSRIEYYSLPAMPALALVMGWRLKHCLDDPQDRCLVWPLLGLGLLGLTLLFLLPHLEQICTGNRREFSGMFDMLAPVARRASIVMPALALGGAAAGLLRRPRLTLACFGTLALAIVIFTFQALATLSPHLSDKLPGEYLRHTATADDVIVMEQIEEFEYGASLEYYSGRRILMVQRGGLPQFPYPVPPAEDYIISPEGLHELWSGPRRVFLLIDDTATPEPYLREARVALAISGKRLLVNR
jgi:hypothetical protein